MYNYELTDNALKTWIRLRQASEATEKVLEKVLGKHDAIQPLRWIICQSWTPAQCL